eukprot:CAMPEP_0170800936 /NCGR_PEP_ID=MMETSP0733-20121128/28188_1 /TAXON_ID=186038 /ORGANISM="Fragilariopsis kerguelensis, Strain L26-C5" /LENGTH=523 /DNA_ID=CAMNT_0011153455 /DNA_START=1 /DNA_END=1569 /DNA_ORIENTATION=+
MSTTFDTAALTLDASINRLQYMKAEARIYHRNQIAEARHLSVEAIRLINDAKLANDRAEEMKKTIAMFQLERRVKQTVQQEKIQAKSLLIAPTVEEEVQVVAAEVRKEVTPQYHVTEPTVKEQPKGTVNEEELAKEHPVKNKHVKEETALIAPTKKEEFNAPAAEVRKEDLPTSVVTTPTVKEQPNEKSNGTIIEEELFTALHEGTKNDTIEEQSTQEERMMVDTAFEEEVTTGETVEEETTQEEITTVETVVEETTTNFPHPLSDSIAVLLEHCQSITEEIATVATPIKEASREDHSEEESVQEVAAKKDPKGRKRVSIQLPRVAASVHKKDPKGIVFEEPYTHTTDDPMEEEATKEDIAIETVVATGRVVQVVETWKVGQPEGGGVVDNNNTGTPEVSPAGAVFPSLLSWTADSDDDGGVDNNNTGTPKVSFSPAVAVAVIPSLLSWTTADSDDDDVDVVVQEHGVDNNNNTGTPEVRDFELDRVAAPSSIPVKILDTIGAAVFPSMVWTADSDVVVDDRW